MHAYLDIGNELVTLRRSQRMTQRELGLALGVSQPQIARWEATGYRTATLGRVSEVAAALRYAENPPAGLCAAETVATYNTSLPGSHPEALRALGRIAAPPSAVAAFARSHGIARIDLFGSVLTDQFGPDSDIDLLVSYEPGRTPSLLQLSDYAIELEAILRRRVDLITRTAVERSGNPLRRRHILNSARTLYARP